MKKAICLIAVAAISLSSVMAYPASNIKLAADSVKTKTKVKHKSTKIKIKKKTPKASKM